MHVTIPLLAAVVGGLSAVAAAQEPKSCVVPEVFFNSLPETFTLSALVPGPEGSYPPTQPSWSFLLSPDPSSETIGKPIISQTRIAQPEFRLVNQTLVTVDGDFAAELGVTILIFPPVLRPFTFGGPEHSAATATFGAIYACDSTGKQILKLVSTGGEGFAVNEVAERQQVFIKPSQFAGEAVDVTLRINGGQ